MKILFFILIFFSSFTAFGQNNSSKTDSSKIQQLEKALQEEKLKNQELEREKGKIVIWLLVLVITLIITTILIIKLNKDLKKWRKEEEELEKKNLQKWGELNKRLTKLEQEMDRQEYELIAAVAHSFKNKLSPVKQNYSVLLRFLNKQYQEGILAMDKMVRLPQGNETPEDVDTYERLAKRLEKQLAELPKIFNDFQVLQKQIVDIQKIDLNEYFKKIPEKYAGKNYKITIEPTQNPLLVNLDQTAFESVLDNLISNAQTHGFKEENRFYQIDFILSEEQFDNQKGIKIICRDNGVGFPSNYTFEQYKTFGNKSVYSEGSGIGGFVIGKIIELHKGKVRLIPTNKNDSFKTQIEILLPSADQENATN